MHFIQTYLNQHSNIPYLIHPLILPKTPHSFIHQNTKNHFQSTLLPFPDVLTPNIPQPHQITPIKINHQQTIPKPPQIFINQIPTKPLLINPAHSA
ncbi:bifunctional hydroxymethylpyrimidine kinase/phosphomethylpyrimidine kinase, partial [Staphylococcus epidermidis]|uniref:bifunctional hydroxymethylpyrimidine kinase/phosphomethylpyrimidine kinase n=1 Tax=Staphylococcus epidermidis TaxID=1282 RepID=UPI0037D9D517